MQNVLSGHPGSGRPPRNAPRPSLTGRFCARQKTPSPQEKSEGDLRALAAPRQPAAVVVQPFLAGGTRPLYETLIGPIGVSSILSPTVPGMMPARRSDSASHSIVWPTALRAVSLAAMSAITAEFGLSSRDRHRAAHGVALDLRCRSARVLLLWSHGVTSA